MTEDFKRKLTAILSADVVGYSRLMGEDEESTVRTLNKYKKTIFSLIEKNNGRVIDSPGDNVLSEFASIVDAVRCGIQIQEDLKASNEELPTDKRMEFRIGIHTGDVIQDGNRIYGDGVNVAARIESLADPGGICLSRTAYDQVKAKINIDYEYLGEFEVKNITEPIRVYKVILGAKDTDRVGNEKTSVEILLGEIPKVIVVLPFADISTEKDQEAFVDGLSEEIRNSLVRIPGLNVIGRSSSFALKGSNKTSNEIGELLGATHTLEGSVRKVGNKLRITTELVNVVDGIQLWSEKYDRELADIFDIQEDIANNVANKLKLILEAVRLLGGTKNIEAYELYLNARGKRAEDTISGYESALELLDAAINLDPKFALAWAYKAHNHMLLNIFGPKSGNIPVDDAGQRAAEKSIELEPNLSVAYINLGLIKAFKSKWLEAGFFLNKALELSGKSLSGDDHLIIPFYLYVGKFKRAYELLEEIRRNDPIHQVIGGYYYWAHSFFGDRQKAEEVYKNRNKSLLKGYSDWHDGVITIVRLGSGDVVSSDEIVYSDPILNTLKKYLDSPDKGIVELQRIYSSDDNLSIADLHSLCRSVAYFGNSEFAMEIIEKSVGINADIINCLWSPTMRKIRKTPRFKEFVRKIGLVEYWKQYGWPDRCSPVGDDDFECD